MGECPESGNRGGDGCNALRKNGEGVASVNSGADVIADASNHEVCIYRVVLTLSVTFRLGTLAREKQWHYFR
jgi:hypothetical protein